MWSDIVTIFTEMGVVPAVFLTIGMILFIIEVFMPGFGIFGIMGMIMSVVGIIFRIIAGATVLQIFLMIGMLMAVILLLLIIFSYAARIGLLSGTGLVEMGTSVSKDYASDDKNYAHLLGKVGLTYTVCKPVGKVIIDNLYYQVFSNGEYLPKGVNIKVIEVDGADIIVKRI